MGSFIDLKSRSPHPNPGHRAGHSVQPQSAGEKDLETVKIDCVSSAAHTPGGKEYEPARKG